MWGLGVCWEIVEGDDAAVDGFPQRQVAARLFNTNVALPDLDGAAVDPTLVTVVIPARDRGDQLERTLGALGPTIGRVVVDDASHDPSEVASVAARHGAEVIPLTTNLGPAGARNAGLAAVRSPYVAFVDSDITVTTGTLLRLARHFEDPSVALVGPLITGVTRSPRPRWFQRYDERSSSLTMGTIPGVVRPGAAVAWLPSACLVARTCDLAGGFDPTMRVGEDVDLVWRLIAAGRTVRYDPTQVAHHDTRTTFRGWLTRKFVYGTSAAALAIRHGSNGAPAVLSPAMALAALAILARRKWSLPLAALCTATGARTLNHSLTRAVPRPRQRLILSTQLSLRGLGWAIRQECALLLRHWWPATLLLCLVSARARRLLVSALLVDTALAVAEHPCANPLETFAGRRLDDLAYGTGLWAGALRNRSTGSLKVRVLRADRDRATHSERSWWQVCPRHQRERPG